MRVSEKEIAIIKTLFKQIFSAEDHLWLFGSRVDDSKFGGDIDLYIETQEVDAEKVVKKRTQLGAQLWVALDEQKIDIVVNQLSSKHELLVYKLARETGIQLV